MKEVRFVKSVYHIEELPKQLLPELVLCGRSNVGKSSFLNSLFNMKRLAKTSSDPGKTRGLNYYLVENRFYIVDLPGFGYAKVSMKERLAWQQLIEKYFLSKRKIELVLHIIDSRHKPTNLDIYLNRFLKEMSLPYSVILNKIDKLKRSEVLLSAKKIIEYFPELINEKNLFLYSSLKGTGKAKVLNYLNNTLLK